MVDFDVHLSARRDGSGTGHTANVPAPGDSGTAAPGVRYSVGPDVYERGLWMSVIRWISRVRISAHRPSRRRPVTFIPIFLIVVLSAVFAAPSPPMRPTPISISIHKTAMSKPSMSATASRSCSRSSSRTTVRSTTDQWPTHPSPSPLLAAQPPSKAPDRRPRPPATAPDSPSAPRSSPARRRGRS